MSSNPYGNQPPQVVTPPQTRPGSGSSAMTIVIILSVVIVALLMCMGILVALLLPAVQASREAARRMSCQNNLKMIGLALHNYHSAYGSFPPAFTVDEDGNPLHSWRTLILPFVEYSQIYTQIDFDKPWDDPVNLPYSQMSIPFYACPSAGLVGTSLTTYQAIDDPRSIMFGSEPRKMTDVTDGTSNTVIVVESSELDAVPWMKPQDLPLQNFINPAGKSSHLRVRNILMTDGSVFPLSNNVSASELEALVTYDGGEVVTALDRN